MTWHSGLSDALLPVTFFFLVEGQIGQIFVYAYEFVVLLSSFGADEESYSVIKMLLQKRRGDKTY